MWTNNNNNNNNNLNNNNLNNNNLYLLHKSIHIKHMQSNITYSTTYNTL